MNLKVRICAALIAVLKFALGILYAVFKCFPSRNKTVFLSRQGNRPGLDFLLLEDSLRKEDPTLETVMITAKLEKNIPSLLRFFRATLRSMYHLATASVCILDTYWPLVSLLNHKPDLAVIQIWHAIGKLKQSGHQTLDKGYGRGKSMAQLLNMHKGYDVVIAGGKSMNAYYCASFGVEESQLYNIGLPRIDYLLDNRRSSRELLESSYPETAGKTVVLYVPTFRRGTLADYTALTEAFRQEDSILIVKPHPHQDLADPESLAPYRYTKLNTMQALCACDIVITDYSAISLEAAVLSKPVYFYLFDHEDYMRNNGVNINPCVEMPNNVYYDPEQLIQAIRNGTYDTQALAAFQERYLPGELGTSTGRLTKLILDCIKDGKHEGIRKNLHRVNEAGLPVDH